MILLKNAVIVTGVSASRGTLGIDGEIITGIWDEAPAIPGAEVIDLEGMLLMAGGIDAHVHFREPGMTWKADIGTESQAAVLGGITSFIDMPNTSPAGPRDLFRKLWVPHRRDELQCLPDP